MCNVVKSHLMIQERPDYLHPVDEDGNMPWKKDDAGTSTPLAQGPSPAPSRPPKRPRASPVQESSQVPSHLPKKSKAIVETGRTH